MNYHMAVKLNNKKILKVKIDRPELIYGATKVVSNKVDKGVFGYNPVTNEVLDIVDLGEKEDRFFIPSHIQKDYETAIKNNWDLHQVVAPYFLGKGDETPIETINTQIRYSVVAVIKNALNDTYLCEAAKGRNCKSFVMGGIEEGETSEEAAIRETVEETGYDDIKIDKVCNFVVINHFYAEYKNVNRYAYLNIVFGRLNSNIKTKITEQENAKHEVLWIEKNKLKEFINIPLNKYVLDILLNGEKAFTDKGIMITLDENNGKMSETVRSDIINRYCLSND